MNLCDNGPHEPPHEREISRLRREGRRLTEENERLRTALERIVAITEAEGGVYKWEVVNHTARAALAESEEKK